MWSIMDLPEGASDSDPRWQRGYADGEDDLPPSSPDPVYVSGWCHGHNAANQCRPEDSAAAFAKKSPSPLAPRPMYEAVQCRVIENETDAEACRRARCGRAGRDSCEA